MSTGGAIQIKGDIQSKIIRSLINGGDESSWATIADMSAAVNDGPNPLDFIIFRGSTGYGDDQAYTHNAAIAKDVVVKNKDGSARGALLWGSYMFLAYSSTSKPGGSQAANFWSLINAGGSHYWQIPPAIDVERETFFANGVIQYVPLPDLETYLDTKLMPAIEYLEAQNGRLPVLYLNLDMALHYLKPAYGRADHKYDKIFKCPLWLAVWSSTVPSQSILSPLFPTWAFWQKRGDVHDNPGTTDIDYNEWPGDRASLKAWIADPNFPIPAYSTNTPPPPPPPVTETWATIQTTGLRERVGPGVDAASYQVGSMLNGAKVKVNKTILVGRYNFAEFTGYFAVTDGASTWAKLEEIPITK